MLLQSKTLQEALAGTVEAWVKARREGIVFQEACTKQLSQQEIIPAAQPTTRRNDKPKFSHKVKETHVL